MKILLLFCIIFLHSIFCRGQFDTIYYKSINEARIAILKNDKKEALSLFSMAFKNQRGFNSDYDDAINLALDLRKRKLAIKFAKNAVKFNGFQFYNSIRGKDFFKYKDSKFLKVIQKKYPNWRKYHRLHQSEEIIKFSYLIRGFCETDQNIRVYIHNSDSQTWKYTNKIDSINYFEFKEAVNLFGFPEISKLDQKIVQDLELLLIHFRTLSTVTNTPQYEMIWLDSLMKAQIIKGNVHPTVFAYSYDRDFCLKSKINNNVELQWFGQFNSLSEFTEIDRVNEVDKRRSSIFLLPISISSKLSNLPLPKNYISN